MNNCRLLIAVLCVTLCAFTAIPQEKVSAHSVSWASPCDTLLSIEEIISLADANSKQLRPLISGLKEAEEGVKVAKSNRLPELKVDLAFSYLGDGFVTDRNFTNFEVAPIPHYGNNLAIEASQVIYAGGAISNGIAVANLYQDLASQQLEDKRNNLHFTLIGYYLDIYKCRNMRQVLVDNIEQTRGVIKEMQAREKEGIVLENDITRYELLLSNLKLALTNIDNTLSILNRNMCTALGLEEHLTIIPDTTILHKTLPNLDRHYWQESALHNSSVLKMADTGVKISKKQENIIQAERLPHLALFAGYHLDGPITIEVPPIDKNFSYWCVGVNINYNISSLFKTNKKLSQSRIATKKAREQYDAVEEEIFLAINADYTRYMEAYEEYKTQQKSVELAIQNYNVTANRYRNDMALITDMLDASNAKLDAEQKLVNAQINILYYYYKLQYISGLL